MKFYRIGAWLLAGFFVTANATTEPCEFYLYVNNQLKIGVLMAPELADKGKAVWAPAGQSSLLALYKVTDEAKSQQVNLFRQDTLKAKKKTQIGYIAINPGSSPKDCPKELTYYSSGPSYDYIKASVTTPSGPIKDRQIRELTLNHDDQ